MNASLAQPALSPHGAYRLELTCLLQKGLVILQ